MLAKIKKIQILRHLTQIASIFLLPGLYILAFNELKTIYTMIIRGDFNFLNAFPSLIELTTVIFTSILIGRFFCGWFCTFGAYNDLIYFISKQIFKVKFKVDPKVDAVLKYTKYFVLVFIAAISWTMGSTILQSADPWEAFAQITDISNVLSTLTIGLILLVLITIGAFFIERFFCRYLCPLGAVFTIISKIGIFKFSKPNDKCGNCRICTTNCSMGLPLYDMNSVCGGECINCFKCVETCPRKNTQANVLGQDVNPVLASSIAIAAFAGVYALNNVGSTVLTNAGLASETTISETSNSAATSSKYKDGTYTGSGTGFKRGTTTISVTIKNGQITTIETVSNQDTPSYYTRAESNMFTKIKSAQSTSIDTVSGATFTCEGIISAVNAALTKAESANATSTSSTDTTTSTSTSSDASTSSKNTTTDSSTTEKSNTTTTTTTTTNNNNEADTNTSSSTTESSTTQVQYKDGTYTGSGTGYKRGTTTLSVTVKDGKISSIETISSQDTPDFYDRAETVMFNKILSAQSTSVDTLSRATFTSKGIISAVKSALTKAV